MTKTKTKTMTKTMTKSRANITSDKLDAEICDLSKKVLDKQGQRQRKRL